MDIINTVGRRKESIAKIFLSSGDGKILINKKPLADYFKKEKHRICVLKPLELLGKQKDFNLIIKVQGGGFTGQTEAIQLGIARALIVADPATRIQLKKERMLTRDSRTVEPKKYGLKKARRAPQFSKR
ncbi:MAG: 30S ribosomal protein S9 [Bacteroidota bacterium]